MLETVNYPLQNDDHSTGPVELSEPIELREQERHNPSQSESLPKDRPELLVPRSAAWFLGGFHRFLRPYLKRHFSAIAVERGSIGAAIVSAEMPVIVYANHPSWWDPLIAHFLHRSLFAQRHFFAPIDAQALDEYRVFAKLGFYGVQMSSASGAGSFLKKSMSILSHSDSVIWMTPEGRFADPRDHDATLMPGLAHLCSRCKNVVVIPLAIEYVFWDERLPVCLTSFGDAIQVDANAERSKTDWANHLEEQLRSTQRRLSQHAIKRSSEPFRNLLRGTKGGGWLYDTCRRVKAFATGREFKANHGDQFQ